ncbi:MAG: vWA domain-containing protein [Pseudomonadota bacterium]
MKPRTIVFLALILGSAACEPEDKRPPLPPQHCTRTAKILNVLPFDIYLLVDRSGSMSSLWAATKSALTSFFSDSKSAGINVGFNLFPAPAAIGNTCDPNWYDPPQSAVGSRLAVLPYDIRRLQDQLDTPVGGGTPMYGALDGTYQAAIQRKQRFPENTVVVVISGDGAPTGSECDTYYDPIQPQDYSDIDVVATLTADAYSTHGIPTYGVVVASSAEYELNLIAAAGGTGQAYNVSSDVSQFTTAMAEIRDSVSVESCVFLIPDLGDEVLQPDLVNVMYSDLNTPEKMLAAKPSAASCGTGEGWYFDNARNPRNIGLCPATCTRLEDSSSAALRFVYGCETGGAIN